MPPPYQGTGIEIFGPNSRRLRSMDRSSAASSASAGAAVFGLENLKRSLSKPPPEAPWRYSRSPCFGVFPVSAIVQVENKRSAVQRGSPSAFQLSLGSILMASVGHWGTQ